MDPGKLMLLVTIVERPRGEEAARLCAGAGLHYHLGALGKGTASGEMLDLLGLGERDKAVILSLIPAARSRELREYLCRELQLRYPGRGILFTLPLSGINARAAAGLAAMAPQEKGAEPMEQQERRPLWEYHLILASVPQGCADQAMEAAREAGASGGTLLHTRRAGSHEAEKFFAITLQKEMELVAILAREKDRPAIMQAIARTLRLEGKEGGSVFSLPVEAVEGLSEG